MIQQPKHEKGGEVNNMSTFNAIEEYPKLLHEFELAEQRIAKLEAQLVIATEQRNGYASQRNDLVNELEKLEIENDNLREAGQAVVDMWDGKDGACVEISAIEALREALGHD